MVLLKKVFSVDYININIEVYSFILIETMKSALKHCKTETPN